MNEILCVKDRIMQQKHLLYSSGFAPYNFFFAQFSLLRASLQRGKTFPVSVQDMT